MADFKQLINKLKMDSEKTLAEGTADSFERLDAIIEELDVEFREFIQMNTASDMKRIIQSLKSGRDLTPQDKELIELWIVGDAEYYTEEENNAEDWKNELKRIMQEVGYFASKDLGIRDVAKLRALLRDGSRVLDDLFFFTEQKERVARFLDSTREIDEEARVILANLLEQKLKLDQF